MTTSVLLMTCPDEPGLIAHLSTCLHEHSQNIVTLWEYVCPENQRFFLRVEFDGHDKHKVLEAALKKRLPKATQLFFKEHRKKRLVLMATKEPHCLGEILLRATHGDLNGEVVAVVANHDVLRPLVDRFGIPFHCVSAEGKTRVEHEHELLRQISRYSPDFVVLAKYMRILSEQFVAQYYNRVINIHHSFLPAFAGAKPYQQAFERGVKIIGATAHFVNEQLDDGPIIVQNVTHVDHSHTADDMAKAGRDVEKTTLAQALDLVLDDRVMVNGRKAVVFA